MAAPPFKVKSVYDYTSEHEDDLNFPLGQVINVTELEGDDWYVGEYTDATGAKKEGLFPTNFVEKYEPEVPTRPTRPARAKQEAQPPAPAPTPASAPEEPEKEDAPPVPAGSKPQAPLVDIPAAVSKEDEPRSPPSATSQRTPIAKTEPPPAPKPAPAEPAEPAATPKKAPPPVAAKSNAFKDRIAAFNQPAAAPIAPMQPGRQQHPTGFIKKPFVAPPPSKNAYVPPPKVEQVHKPYVRDEDPEIKQREDEDRAAAEAAGLTTESIPAAQEGEDEDAPKPMTLRERMAMLQKQQQEQAQRRAEAATKKKEKPPTKKPSESSEHAPGPEGDGEDLERVRSDMTERPSLDVSRERPRVPSAQRRPTEPMSPVPALPEHEILSDGHEADQSGAGEMTEDDTETLGPDKDDSDERPFPPPRAAIASRREPDVGDEEDTTEGDEGEEEDQVDEETRRKEELRARMARLGGGMPGMGAPFNPFGASPPAAGKKKASKERKASEGGAPTSPAQTQQRAPMVPVPGMQRIQSPESDRTLRTGDREVEPEDELEEDELPPPPRRSSTMERGAPPPVPKDSRPLPPPPQDRRVSSGPISSLTSGPLAAEPRPVPPPPPAAAVMSPGPGSESDDELSTDPKRSSAKTSGVEPPLPTRGDPPPLPGSRDVPPRPVPLTPDSKRISALSSSEPPSATSDKRSSRQPPPVPGGSPTMSARPPPPPPPSAAPPSRQSTGDMRPPSIDDNERIETDYDGDYDTDIASSAKHKDALKAPHNREPSLTDSTTGANDTPVTGAIAPPPPQTSAPRPVPPQLPQAAPKTRPSMDRPPPPVPSARDATQDESYDPYRYTSSNRTVPPVPSVLPVGAPPRPPVQEPESMQDESSADDEPITSQERAFPVPHGAGLPPSTQVPGRSSLDVHRTPTVGRRSTEQGRPSGEQGQIANDINLSQDTPWWTADQPLPPALQSRNGVDLLSESEESSKSKRGGRKEITKDIYVLYIDYSQTVISVRYDSHEPSDVHLEQRHEAPPPRLRQDQLETAWQRFGTKIADAASSHGNSKKDSVVGNGSPYSLPLELIRAQRDALLPVGTRTYGALVYANLANASTMQYDEIRRGDIITVRNAKFEGHHGAMKSKYKVDYGPSHVAVVEEWDGTRRAVRAWEQGRDKKGGVRSEKFRLGDLRSGEVRVWRIVGRNWVGWDS